MDLKQYEYDNEYLCSYDHQYRRKGLPTVYQTDERPSPIVIFSVIGFPCFLIKRGQAQGPEKHIIILDVDITRF